MQEPYYELLSQTPLFSQINPTDIPSMLACISAKTMSYKKNQFIFHYGDLINEIGIVLSGAVLIEKEDFWGNRSILSKIAPGFIFAETYALLESVPLEVNVIAQENSEVLFLNFQKLSSTCSNACEFHTQFIHNLLSVVAAKNLMLTKKMEHMSQKTIREKVLSYLSNESKKSQTATFTIPFNRQQLADYLSVDRSALSNELSKLRQEHFIDFHKNIFSLKTDLSTDKS